MTGYDKQNWSPFHRLRFGSLMLRNFGLNLLLVILPMLLIVWLGFTSLQDEMNARVMRMNIDLLNKSAMVTDNLMTSIEELTVQASRQRAVREVLALSAEDPGMETASANALSAIRNFTATSPYIVSFTLYSEVSDFFLESTVGTAIPLEKYRRPDVWYDINKIHPMTSPYILTDAENMLLFCSPIYGGNGTRLGLLVFDVYLQNIRMLLESADALEQGTFFILDNDNQVMYCSQLGYWQMPKEQQHSYRDAVLHVLPGETKLVITDELRIISVVGSTHRSWKYAFITSQPLYRQETSMLRTYLITAAILGGVVCLLSSYIITRVTYRPVKKIIDIIEDPENSAESGSTTESREMLYITGHILASLSSKSQADQELTERLQALKKAQALALQFQIDPHFLYNTMEIINWSAIAEIGIDNRTSKLVTSVAKLYRICLDKDNMILSLKEEMNFLRLYLDVLNARFGSRIQVVWEIPEELHNSRIIKMCMQPLVENAVNHALKPQNYTGTLRILAWREAEKLCVAVEDDGLGIPGPRLKEINTKLQNREERASTHIGLQNVNERVKLIYGNEYGVSLQQVDGADKRGTRAIITFPYTESEFDLSTESEGNNE